MATTADTFQTARRLHRGGDRTAAVRIYREILDREPDHADALHLLGVAAFQEGRHDEAIAQIGRAIGLRDDVAAYHDNLGLACRAAGRLEEASHCLERAIRLAPANAVAHQNLGLLRLELDDPDGAALAFEQARRFGGDDVEAELSLGKTLRRQGRLEQAADRFGAALTASPEREEAHYYLGAVRHEQGRHEEAIGHLRDAVALRPEYGDAWSLLGAALTRLNRFDEAESSLEEALRLKPDDAATHTNRAILRKEQGRVDEAVGGFREALRIKPDMAAAASNLGSTYMQADCTAEALTAFELALRIAPDLVDAHWNRALALLTLGDYAEGWREYEWRWLKPGRRRKRLPQPLWDGRELGGERILCYSEQGLGDTLQFVRYARVVAARGGRMVLRCQKALIPLLSLVPELEAVHADWQELPTAAWQAPLMSLPGICGTTLDTVPADVPYLAADEGLVARWAEPARGSAPLQVGIGWQGNPEFPSDRWRSPPLAALAPLARIAGVELVSLQKGPGSEQLEEVAFPVRRLPGRVDEEAGPFMDTASILASLDLVITSDSALAHLAGGLGRPTWLALSTGADWRWLLDRDDSPWYPTLRLFRQTDAGDWEGLFKRMATELAAVSCPAKSLSDRPQGACG